MLELAEVLLAQAVERRAIELRGAADEVVDLRLERRAGAVLPRIGRDVAVLDEDLAGGPVLRLARQPIASLEQQDALAGRREVRGQCPTARAGADDDDVVVLHQEISSISSARMIRPAASISARCEKA